MDAADEDLGAEGAEAVVLTGEELVPMCAQLVPYRGKRRAANGRSVRVSRP